MAGDDAQWRRIVEDARRYPSPHNSQPIRIAFHDERHASVYYDLDRGLPAESFGIPFGLVCAGVFLESLRVVARARGFDVEETLDGEELDFGTVERLQRVARVRLVDRPATPEDAAGLERFRARRTSRRPYDTRLVPADVIREAEDICREGGFDFRHTDDPALVKRIVRVNQATLFDDLRNDAVHAEIMTWLRFSRQEAEATRDGLSAETMLLPGGILRFAMSHRGMWEMPVLGPLIRAVYLRTMRGVRQLGWIEGRFASATDYVAAGHVFLRLWLAFTAHDVVLHPFGTVVTNPRSYREFVNAVGADVTDERMAWMLFRFGYSAEPPLALRRDADEMIVAADPERNPS